MSVVAVVLGLAFVGWGDCEVQSSSDGELFDCHRLAKPLDSSSVSDADMLRKIKVQKSRCFHSFCVFENILEIQHQTTSTIPLTKAR